ncbi:MAG TPA: GAF domain-containing protein [Terriglobales bacterium]
MTQRVDLNSHSQPKADPTEVVVQQGTLRFASFSNEAGQERRRHPRLKMAGMQPPAFVEIAPGQPCAIVDISEGGIRLRSDSYAHFPPKGKLRFTLPGANQSIEVLAQLAWVNRQGNAGLKFLEVYTPVQRSFSDRSSSASEPTGNGGNGKVVSIPRSPAMSLVSLREKVFVLRSQYRVALHLIVKQIMALMKASGAVIAVQDERSRIVCLASSGRAPGIGAVLKPDSGLSGECVRSAAMVYCDDAQNDSRIDPKLVNLLGFNSMIVFPLRVEERVVGVVEVFGEKPGQFSSDDIELLGKIAELVLDVYEPPATSVQTATSVQIEEAGPPPAPRPAAPKAPEPEPKLVEPIAPKVIDSAPKLELVKPKVVERVVEPQKQVGAALPVSPPVVKPAQHGIPGVCDVCGHKNAPDARDCESCDVPMPVAIEMDAKPVKRKPVAFEIPERDDRWERLASALWRPLLFLIVLITALLLIKSHWNQLRGISDRLHNSHPISSAAASTAITQR